MIDYTLRKIKKSDANSIAKYANNAKIAKNLRDTFPSPYEIENAKKYIEYLQTSDEYMWCIDVGGECVGVCSVVFQKDIHVKSGEIGYWLGEPFWGQGIMTDAVGKICREVFEKFDIVRIYAEVFSFNKSSQKVLEKNNFKMEGVLKNSVFKHGKIYDAFLYSLLK